MTRKILFFLNPATISSLGHRICSSNHVNPSILSFITTSFALFPFSPPRSPNHRYRWRHDRQSRPEGDGCFPEITRCVVCLDDLFCDDGSWLSLTVCKHCFHGDCVKKWLDYNPTCPMCRAKVKRPSNKGWLHYLWRFLLSRFLRWIDRCFDSELALAFCDDS